MLGRAVDFIVVHCSATKPSMDVGAAEIDRWHKDRGWRMIGYHAVIRRNGVVEQGRTLDDDHVLETDEVGAHVENYNSKSVGVCMVGGVNDNGQPDDNFTDEQWSSLGAIVRSWQIQFPNAKVVGHRDLDGRKACPSFDVAAWLRRVGL